jgi:hypothetical protein
VPILSPWESVKARSSSLSSSFLLSDLRTSTLFGPVSNPVPSQSGMVFLACVCCACVGSTLASSVRGALLRSCHANCTGEAGHSADKPSLVRSNLPVPNLEIFQLFVRNLSHCVNLLPLNVTEPLHACDYLTALRLSHIYQSRLR